MDFYTCNGKLLDFLLYAYLGFDSNEVSQNNKTIIQEKCAQRAYLDLARTIKFQYSTSELKEKQKRNASEEDGKLTKEYVNEKENIISEICKNITSPTKNWSCTDASFNYWHKEKCEEIRDKMNNGDKIKLLKEDFTYGQAQKWINMTLKYLWLLDMLPKELPEKSLHAPIDGLILEKLNNVGVCEITCTENTYYFRNKPWSKFEEKDYKDIQEKIQEEIKKIAGKQTVIEWEGSAWLEIAKVRSNKKSIN